MRLYFLQTAGCAGIRASGENSGARRPSRQPAGRPTLRCLVAHESCVALCMRSPGMDSGSRLGEEMLDRRAGSDWVRTI